MADTIFTTQTPTGSDNTDADSRSVAMRFQVHAAGHVFENGRVWVHADGIPDGCEFQIWDFTTFDRIYTRNMDDAVGSNAWFEFTIPDVAVVEDRFYYVALWYPNTPHTWVFDDTGTFPIVNGVVDSNSAAVRVGGNVDDLPDTPYEGWLFVDISVAPAVTDLVIEVGQAVETNTAHAIGYSSDLVINVGQAVETDTAHAINYLSDLVIAVGQAAETDTAHPITFSASGAEATPNMSTTYVANMLAGTIVNGVPTLTTKAALSRWAGLPDFAEMVESLNTEAGNTRPNWLTATGAANQLAGTSGLSLTDCLVIIANA